MFGGFEDLSLALAEHDNEEDELENIPTSKKTKNGGYLKDGFVVDSELEDDYNDEDDETDDDVNVELKEEVLVLEDIGSELSEEAYEYSDEEEE